LIKGKRKRQEKEQEKVTQKMENWAHEKENIEG